MTSVLLGLGEPRAVVRAVDQPVHADRADDPPASSRTEFVDIDPVALLSIERRSEHGTKSAPPLPDAVDPGAPLECAARAFELERLGAIDEALGLAECLVALRPDHSLGWALLAHLRARKGQHELAVVLGRRALWLNPGDLQARYNLAVSLQELGRVEEALAHYREVLVRNERHRAARVNLGACLRRLGRTDEAVRVWRSGVAIDPDSPELRFNLACALLQSGTWPEAWAGYEERWAVHRWGELVPAGHAPRWHGERLAGRLLVVCEQGLGDTLQFIRLLPRLADRVANVTVRAPRRLHRLLERSPAVRRWIRGSDETILAPEDGPPPPAEAWVPLLSLPGILDLGSDTIGADLPYLRAEPALVSSWRTRLDATCPPRDGELRIGLVWQGNPNAPAEQGRSVPLAALQPLAGIRGIRFVVLQKEHGREQLATAPPALIAADLGPELDIGPDAFVDTAAVLECLDLLVTSDTAIAHLAGALGKPVWLLLKHVPDWRWPADERRTAWYPTMRLFHQPSPGDWTGAVARLAEALENLVALRRSFRSQGPVAPAVDPLVAHREGRLHEAIEGYRLRLATSPDRPDLLHHLAVARFAAQGIRPPEPPKPLDLVEWAADRAPRDADVHANFGLLLKASGRRREAEVALRHALALTRWAHGPAAVNLVNLLLEAGATDRAAEAAEKACAVAADPDRLAAMARVLERTGRRAAAIETWRRVLAAEPGRGDAWVALGSLLHAEGRRSEAVAAFERALVLDPDNADALTNLGVLERQWGCPHLAVWFHRRAADVRPDHLVALTNLGAALLDIGELEKGEQALRQAVRLKPDHADAHMALGMALLLQGRMEEGLREYEWRLSSSVAASSEVHGPPRLWQGGDPAGLRFLLLAEQGFGDAFQFVRYAAVLKARGAASVIVGCRAPIARLLAGAVGVDGVVTEGQPLPAFDAAVHMMSLPYRLGTRPDSIPASIPYLAADPELVTTWAERMAGKPGLRVGLSWQGNPDPRVDHGRSIPLSALAPLANIPGVRLISLQKGPGREQIEVTRHVGVETLEPELDPGPDAFLDTAAVMMNLDLVVTTDTAVAHLAGALGRPVWLLLKHPPEWRWLLEGESSPWYPTMRLFRQSVTGPGENPWSPVIERVAAELRRLACGERSRLLPTWVAVAGPGARDAGAPAHSTGTDTTFDTALSLHRSGRLRAAERAYGRLLAREPEHREALHMLGVCAWQRGSAERAFLFLARARRLGLRTPEHASNFALALKALGRLADAERELRTALEARPDFTEARVNLANLLSETDRPDEASEVLSRALDPKTASPSVWRALGNLQVRRGAVREGVRALLRARAAAPDDAEIRLDLAHALLAAGDLREGFREYEWRWRSGAMQPRPSEAPVWDGGDLAGRTLLVEGEQGLGDHIMLARFLPRVARCGGSVVVACRAELHGLFRAAFEHVPNITFAAQGAPLPPFDVRITLASLPFVFGIDLGSIPARVPYLRADEPRIAWWRAWLGEEPGLRVGLVWQGNPTARADRGRSIALECLEPILSVPGVRFVALQKEHGLDQLRQFAPRYPVRHPGPEFDAGPDAFLDSAALLSCLDLIVTTDTALAHLAGALARPTWLLLKFAPDWRWLTRRTDSPWYPTMRLYRQPRPGDWRAVVSQVAFDLAALAADRRAPAAAAR